MTQLTRRHALIALASTPLLPLAGGAQAATHTVRIEGFAFSPANLSVAVGDTVVFENKDGAPHTATAENGSFDTGRLNKNQSGTVTVSAAGSHDYKCAFHPNMKGRVTAG